MKLNYECDEYRPWAGAVDTWERIQNENKEDSFWQLMEELYGESGSMDECQVNDILWFESEWVFETLGIRDEEEEEEDED